MDFVNWSTMQWLAVGLLCTGAVVGFFIWMEMKRREFRKAVKGKILVELLRVNNYVDEGLYNYKGKTVDIKDTEGSSSTVYFLRRDAGWNAWWPTSGLLRALGTQVRKFHFIEGDPEPQTKRLKEPVVTGKVIRNMIEEKFTELAVLVSARMEQMQRAMSKVLNPTLIYILLVVAIVASATSAYMAWQVQASLDAIKQALGIG